MLRKSSKQRRQRRRRTRKNSDCCSAQILKKGHKLLKVDCKEKIFSNHIVDSAETFYMWNFEPPGIFSKLNVYASIMLAISMILYPILPQQTQLGSG